MPLYSYRCAGCSHEFELLVGSGDAPACPNCGGVDLARLLSSVAPDLKMGTMISSARSMAAKEGHFSNYSAKEKQSIKYKP